MRGNTAKSKKLLFEGRSIVLNVLFIAMHVFGAAFLLHAFFVDLAASGWIKVLGLGMFLTSTVMLFVLKGYYMYAYFARLVLAVVLLISGFSKLNDPVGFAQIVEQYFQDGALSLKMGQSFGWADFSLAKYSSWAMKISVTLAITEILLALMLLYHMLYKLAVFTLLPLVLVFSYVSFYTSTCDEDYTFQHNFTIPVSSGDAHNFKDRCFRDETLVFHQQKDGLLYFSETKSQICVHECGCLGANNAKFFGMELSPEVAFARNLMLLLFAVILFVTQFRMLPNAAFESTLYGICAWIAIIIQGIMTGWLWLIILAGIIIYLATNVRRFGVKFLKSSIGALGFISILLGGILYYVIAFEPLSDFRPYAIGASVNNLIVHEATETTTVYVYQHKFTNKLVYLNEEAIKDSPIISDSNYVFLREKELKMNPFSEHAAHRFKPIVSVADIQNRSIEHPLVSPFIEKYAEDLYRVINKATDIQVMLYANQFSQDLYKDTNLIIEKFIGIHEDYTHFDLGSSLAASELVFVWVVKDMRKISIENWEEIRFLSQKLSEQQYDLVSIGYQRAAFWYEKSEINPNTLVYLNMDQDEINQICRSNVCLMVLKKGVVEAKYPLRGLPRFETISAKLKLE
jgi:hypothetical protein